MAIDKKTAPVHTDILRDSGPLRPHLSDPEVSEIMVNRFDRIFIEKAGKIFELDIGFDTVVGLERYVQAVAACVGRELNQRNPCLDTRLPDGSRVSLIIPPVALDGPIITIRKHKHRNLSHEDL